jgi:hypothetical protein
MSKYPNGLPAVLKYGGGTNSSAILVELIRRGYEPPEIILFADTGAEMPHTYGHIKVMSKYAVSNGYPAITVIRSHQKSKSGGIYEMSMRTKRLPAAAYNSKSCSMQFKVEPNELYVAMHFGHGVKYCNIIGYDYDEIRRSEGKEREGSTAVNWYPLIEWEMGRDECVQSLVDAGLPLAGKSSCFICPNMRPHEIKKMAQEYPDLIEKAIALEDNANNTEAKGLGRTWRWKDLIATDDMFGFTDIGRDQPCGCYDGDD